MKSLIKILISLAAVAAVCAFLIPRGGQQKAENTSTPSQITPSATPQSTPVISDRAYDEILNEQEVELMIMDLTDRYPFSGPEVELNADGTLEFKANLDLKRSTTERPAYMDKLVKFLPVDQVSLYVKGRIAVGEEGLYFTASDAQVAGISLTAVEKVVGVNFVTSPTDSANINKTINEVVAANLKARIESLEYGDGFIRLKGKHYDTATAAPSAASTGTPDRAPEDTPAVTALPYEAA